MLEGAVSRSSISAWNVSRKIRRGGNGTSPRPGVLFGSFDHYDAAHEGYRPGLAAASLRDTVKVMIVVRR